jgi:hypothetical protein
VAGREIAHDAPLEVAIGVRFFDWAVHDCNPWKLVHHVTASDLGDMGLQWLYQSSGRRRYVGPAERCKYRLMRPLAQQFFLRESV